MKQWSVGGLVVLLGVLCGGAVAGFGAAAPAQEVARESLDLLKTMARRSATAHTYVGVCVTAIAHAKRYEDRRDAVAATLQSLWAQAANHCRGMALTLCDTPALEAPREACSRIRAFAPLQH